MSLAALLAALPALRAVGAQMLDGVRSPFALVLIGVLALAGWSIAVYRAGSEAAQSTCRAAALEAEIAALRRDLMAAKITAEIAASQAQERAALADTLQKERDDYAAALARRPRPAVCGFDDDDVRRLLRGGSPKAGRR